MATLHVHLRDGWYGDEVSIALNGEEVWAAENVTTRFQIGLAQQLDFEVPDGPVTVEVKLPGEGLDEERDVVVHGEHWVGVSKTDGRLEVREQESEFGYV